MAGYIYLKLMKLFLFLMAYAILNKKLLLHLG